MNPPLTVLMCVRNGAKHLAESMRSILDQTFGDFRFLIVDDDSSDEGPEILRSFGDSRIQLLHNRERLGLTLSLNKGIETASSEFIARMDADDISAPERFAEQTAFMRAHPDVAASGTWARVIDEEGRFKSRLKTPVGAQVNHLRWRPTLIAHPTAIVRTALLKAYPYDPGIVYGQDYDLFLRLSKLGRIDNIPRYLFSYRVHGSNITTSRRGEQLRSSYTTFQKHHSLPALSYEEFISLLNVPVLDPFRRFLGLRKLKAIADLPLGFLAADSLRYCAISLRKVLMGR